MVTAGATGGKIQGRETKPKWADRVHTHFDMRSVKYSSYSAFEVLHWQLCKGLTSVCDG